MREKLRLAALKKFQLFHRVKEQIDLLRIEPVLGCNHHEHPDVAGQGLEYGQVLAEVHTILRLPDECVH